jgi:hypothetical protein
MKISRLLLRPILDSKAVLWLFIIAVLLLNLLSNALYDAAKNRLTRPSVVAIMAVLLLIVMAVGYALSYWIRQRFRAHLVIRDITPRRGLIVLVSQGRLEEIPATAAIKYHFRGEKDELSQPVLTHCWLVTSQHPIQESDLKSQGTSGELVSSAWANAQALKSLYTGKVKKIYVRTIDPQDPENIFQVIEHIYAVAKRLDFEQKDLVADFTGGTKMMSAGMVLACVPEDRDLEYMQPRRFLESGRADPIAGADPKLVDLSFFLRSSKVIDEES